MKTQEKIKEMEKGCGKEFIRKGKLGDLNISCKCGYLGELCPICQAKLEILKSCEEEEKEKVKKFLSVLKEGCGIDFDLDGQDFNCGDDFEYKNKVKVGLCPMCVQKIEKFNEIFNSKEEQNQENQLLNEELSCSQRGQECLSNEEKLIGLTPSSAPQDDLCSECKEKATMRVLNYYVRGQDRSLYFCKIHGKEYNLFHPINEQAEEFEPKKEEVKE